MSTTSQNSDPANRPIISLNQFCRETGVSPVTAWRWRRKGWLATVNIAGRQYVTGKAVADFLRRAEAGEFAKAHATPKVRR